MEEPAQCQLAEKATEPYGSGLSGELRSSSASPRAPKATLFLAFASIYVIWGSTYLAIRYAIETLPPFLMAGVRFVTAGAVLYLWARARSPQRPTPRHWLSATIIGALLFMGGNGSLVWAEQRVASGLAALLLATIPLWIALAGSTGPRGTKLTPRIIVGLALGLAGIGLLVGPSQLLGHGRVDPLGAIVLIAGSVCWALGSLYAPRAPMPRSSLLSASMEMLAGGLVLVAVGLAAGEGKAFAAGAVSLRSTLGLVYLVTFGSLLGFSSYNWLLRHSSPARVATYAYVNPVIAVFLGWAIGGETVTLRTLLATLVVVSAVALIITHRLPPRPAPAAGVRPTPQPEGQTAPVVPPD